MKKIQPLLLILLLLLVSCMLFSCGQEKVPMVTVTIQNGTETATAQIEKGSSFELTTPQKDGFAFGGWYTNETYNGTPLTELTPDADVTIYAKWDKLYTLTLNTNGGTLATTTFSLKSGDSIADLLSNATPEKTGYQFAYWTIGGEQLAPDAKMGAQDITLDALYKAQYTIDVYTQNVTLDGYDKAAESVTGYAFIGELLTPIHVVNGFVKTRTGDSVESLVIGENTEENVFSLYFDRAEYTLTFFSNYPDASQPDTKVVTFRYGVEMDLPFETFTFDGYLLEGWSEVLGGEMKYSSHVTDGRLYNREDKPVEKLTLTGNVSLYAVWAKGYEDLFKGEDIVYKSASDPQLVYLFRGDNFFVGEVTPKGALIFLDQNEKVLQEGVIDENSQKFLFIDKARAEVSYVKYVVGEGHNDNEKIFMDDKNGLKYVKTTVAEDGTASTSTSIGWYVYDESGYMIATFTEGELSGTSMTLILGFITIEEKRTPAFQVRNDAEYDLGAIHRATISDNAVSFNPQSEVGNITLNGFGVATMIASNGQTQNYNYSYNPETATLTMMGSGGAVAGVLRLMYIENTPCYLGYDQNFDKSYELADGGVLSMDGVCTATYTKGDLTVSGIFSVKTSAFGGTIVTFEDNDVVYRFMITTETKDTLLDPTNPDSEHQTVTTTTVTQLPAEYGEYHCLSDTKIYYAPMFVLNTPEIGMATVYGYDAQKVYHKVAEGTMVYDPVTATYTFTVTKRYESTEIPQIPVDFATVVSCTMTLNSTLSQYSINAWISYTTADETVDLTTVYTSADGKTTLTLVGGALAIYRSESVFETCSYTVGAEFLTLALPGQTLYVKLNEEAKTFTAYTSAPVNIYKVLPDGKISQQEYMTLHPINGVSYNVVTGEGEEQTTITYVGKLAQTGGRSYHHNYPIYTFTSDEKEAGTDKPIYAFNFIQIASGTTQVFFVEEAGGSKTYASENGSLTVDGFGFIAVYGDATGLELISLYQRDGDVITMRDSAGKSYYFDIEGSTCSLRGEEYGRTYLLSDNQAFQGKYLEFDGHNGLKVFTAKTVDGEVVREYIDENGTYTVDGDLYTILYKDGGQTVTYICKQTLLTSGQNQYYAMAITHPEIVRSYVNEEDWSVLLLYDDNSAKKLSRVGAVEYGTYSLVTETLLYYVNQAGTDACIYEYSVENGTATPKKYQNRAYYTKSLESLRFSEYGFAIFNNETRYYYTIENDIVTIYKLDATDPAASRYGYVAETFGAFDPMKVYNGKTYYLSDGFALTFKRAAEGAEKYPLPFGNDQYHAIESLTFTPTGSEEFSVNGTATINGQTYNCVVTRALNDAGEAVMTVRIGSYHYTYININYQGSYNAEDETLPENTFDVYDLKYINNLPSYTYLSNFYLFYMYFGQTMSNSIGVLQIEYQFDEQGKVSEMILNAQFGADGGISDCDGNLIKSIESAELRYLGAPANGYGYYCAKFTGADGYTYYLYFFSAPHAQLSTYGYHIYAFAREEVLTTEDGYTVAVSRVIYSDKSTRLPTTTKGSYFTIDLKHNETALENDITILMDKKLYYVVRTKDESGKILSSTYYLIEFSNDTTINVDETPEQAERKVALYNGVTVTPITANTYYTDDQKSYVDVFTDGTVIYIQMDGKNVLITETTYDAATTTYHVTTSDGVKYTITITDGVAVIAKVVEPDPDNGSGTEV